MGKLSLAHGTRKLKRDDYTSVVCHAVCILSEPRP